VQLPLLRMPRLAAFAATSVALLHCAAPGEGGEREEISKMFADPGQR
jgi:hypothetical protein